MTLRFFNTATRTVEDFVPQNANRVTMYNCGPTVYNYVHIGNLRSYIFADTLRRTLEWNGYDVNQVINITDVGHLVSDGDEGEDKMVLGTVREGKNVEEIITQYSDAFYADLVALNTKKAGTYPRATKHIPEQVALIEVLSQKGFVYTTSDGIYFDTSKFPRYVNFAKLDVMGMEAGSRVAMGEKKNSTDFALWKFSPSDGVKREQEWNSPLGILRKGFPGWHIECSAMAMKYLGETLDVHTGGVDHIPVHHSNEIAQSECATGKPFVHYWLHNAHMLVDGQRMAKSLGNGYRLIDLHERGIPPLAYRYWLLTAHYRTQINFTWDALAGAQSAYNRLTNFVIGLKGVPAGALAESYMHEVTESINDDMNTASTIALVWKLVKDAGVPDADKYATLMKIDEVLGLGLSSFHAGESQEVIPEAVKKLAEERSHARAQKDFVTSDHLREEIKKHGYDVKDNPEGQHLEKK